MRSRVCNENITEMSVMNYFKELAYSQEVNTLMTVVVGSIKVRKATSITRELNEEAMKTKSTDNSSSSYSYSWRILRYSRGMISQKSKRPKKTKRARKKRKKRNTRRIKRLSANPTLTLVSEAFFISNC